MDQDKPAEPQQNLDGIETGALRALVRHAAKGNAAAAKAAITEVDRLRGARLGDVHRARMVELAQDPVGMAAYLASLGLGRRETEERLGHRMTKDEQAAWTRALDDRLLEVRAIEIGRMRRGDGSVPTWATRRDP